MVAAGSAVLPRLAHWRHSALFSLDDPATRSFAHLEVPAPGPPSPRHFIPMPCLSAYSPGRRPLAIAAGDNFGLQHDVLLGADSGQGPPVLEQGYVVELWVVVESGLTSDVLSLACLQESSCENAW